MYLDYFVACTVAIFGLFYRVIKCHINLVSMNFYFITKIKLDLLYDYNIKFEKAAALADTTRSLLQIVILAKAPIFKYLFFYFL